MRYRVLFVVLVGLLVCASVYADIPKQINFQGRLTDAGGKFVPDGNYSLTFRIYTDSTGGTNKWTETQIIAVSKGLFNAILGSVTPIPDSIFDYPNTWLGIQVERDPEMTPRQRLSSVGYAYRGAKADTSSYAENANNLDGQDATAFASAVHNHDASYVNEGQASSVNGNMITDGTITYADISTSANISASKVNDGSGSGLDADLLDGLNSSSFLSTASDFGRSGVATDLYEGASTLTTKYVNTTGPDSVVSTSGTALSGKTS